MDEHYNNRGESPTQQYQPLDDQVITQPYSDISHPKLIEWQLDPQEVLDKIEHVLKGEIIVDDKFQRVVKITPINNEGANMLLIWLQPLVSRVITLSTFTGDEIDGELYDFNVGLAKWMVLNSTRYEIDKKSRGMLHDQICKMVKAAYNRAKDGEEKKFLKGTIHVGESYSDSSSGQFGQKKKSFWNNLSEGLRNM